MNGILKSAFGTFRDWYVASRQYVEFPLKKQKWRKRVWAVKEMKSQSDK